MQCRPGSAAGAWRAQARDRITLDDVLLGAEGAVGEELPVASGISPLRMQATGFGETRREGRARISPDASKRRRVKIVIQEVEPIVRARPG